jgi:hypothetical protein
MSKINIIDTVIEHKTAKLYIDKVLDNRINLENRATDNLFWKRWTLLIKDYKFKNDMIRAFLQKSNRKWKFVDNTYITDIIKLTKDEKELINIILDKLNSVEPEAKPVEKYKQISLLEV